MWINNDLYLIKIVLLLFVFTISRLPVCQCVNGCITVRQLNGKQTICSNLNTNFVKIPSGLPKLLVKLEIKHQNIHSLSADQLTDIPMLAELNLDSNKMSSIDSDAFIHVPKLENLTLKNNMLILGGNSFPSSALLYLKSLKILNLENNPLGFVPDFFFQPLRLLQRLYLSRASSGFRIQSNGLAGLTSLEMLDLSFCHLQSLDEKFELSFKNMQLQELYLFGNEWHCNCKMKWLKKWLMRVKDMKIHKTFTRVNGEPGLIQPQCSSPLNYKGRNLFRVSTNYEYLNLNELLCPPKVLTKSRQIEIDQGKNLTLLCEFEADPHGKVSWSKNGMIVQKHWPRLFWDQGQGLRFQARLIITRAEIEDNGSWRCILNTDVGKSNATFSVRVRHSSQLPIDLSIILKYIGIGAVTLILLLVIIGIAIYCVYGFKVRPFVKYNKSRINSRNSRRSQSEISTGNNSQTVPSSNNIRPTLISSNVNKALDPDHINTNDDSQKCLLLPNSPTMILPIDNHSNVYPCPLHGNINMLNNTNSAGHTNQHAQYRQYSANSNNIAATAIQPHTLPRQNGHHKFLHCRPMPNANEQSHIETAANTPCPLHGHILATLQNTPDNPIDSSNNNNDNNNINSVYSVFFSPRHSQPMINTHNNTVCYEQSQKLMSSSLEHSLPSGVLHNPTSPQIRPQQPQHQHHHTQPMVLSATIINSINCNEGATNIPSTSSLSNPNTSNSNTNRQNPPKSHDDEGYSTSV